MPYVYRKLNPEETNQQSFSIPGQQVTPQSQQPSLTRPASMVQQPAYPERILRKIQTAQQYDCQYIPTADDIKEIEFEKYKGVFKDSLVHDILFLRRIKELPSGQEWLVYRYEDTITDDSGTLRTHGYYAGFTTEQVPNIKRNALREITDVTFEREKIVYTIPFNAEAVNQALANADNVPSDFAVCYGSKFGPDPWKGNELTIWNLNDFTTYPFEVLEDANRLGYSKKDGSGIPKMFEEQKEIADQLQDSVKNVNTQKAERELQKAKAYQQTQQAKENQQQQQQTKK